MEKLSSILSEKVLIAQQESQSESEFLDKIICEFQDNKKLHREFIFKYVHRKISYYFKQNEDNLISTKVKVDELIPITTRTKVLLDMENEIDLIMPKTGIPRKNWFFLFLAFLFPLPIFMILRNLLPEFFDFLLIEFFEVLIVIYFLIIGGVLFLVFPSVFETKGFLKIKYLDDFINKIIDQNIYMFWIKDYQKTKEILKMYYQF